MHMRDERRGYQRVSFEQTASLVKDEQIFACQVIDLSIHGVLLRPHGVLRASIGSSYLLEIPLDEQSTSIKMIIKLTHRNPDNLGFVCEKIDIHSIGHLRKIVEFNSEDISKLDRDFETLCQSNSEY